MTSTELTQTGRYLFSGSAIERIDLCAASAVLPAVDEIEPIGTRGRAVHAFLQEYPTSGRDEALVAAPDEWRDYCAALDLTGLEDLLATDGGAEIAIAVNVRTWTARELGRGGDRPYADVTVDEVPCQLDASRVAGRRGLVVDYKSGYGRKLAEWQLRNGALAASLLWDLNDVEVQQINVSDGKPWIRRARLRAMDLLAVKSDLADVHARAMEQRRIMWERGMPDRFAIGDHCRYCPGRRVCPAQTTQIRYALTELVKLRLDLEPLDEATVVELRPKVKSALKALHLLDKQIDDYAAANGPLYLGGPDAAGNHHWYGEVLTEGNEKLDPRISEQVVTELLGPEVARKALRSTITKGDLETAIRSVSKRGMGAKNIALVLNTIRARGGSRRKTSITVEEMITKIRAAPARPAPLPEPKEAEKESEPSD